jgi:hypothetical protein
MDSEDFTDEQFKAFIKENKYKAVMALRGLGYTINDPPRKHLFLDEKSKKDLAAKLHEKRTR